MAKPSLLQSHTDPLHFHRSVSHHPGVKVEVTIIVFLFQKVVKTWQYTHIQWNFSGSNTDGWFTTAVMNSFLSPLEKIP